MLGPTLDKGFQVARVAASALDLAGKSVVVVGGTDGLGRAIARVCAQRGAAVTAVGRTDRDGGATPGLTFKRCDLSSMRAATALGADVLPTDIDLLVFTNGILAAPKRQVTEEGLERDMAVSFLSRLAIMQAYVPRLAAHKGPPTKPLRVFVMGFPGSGQAGELGDLNSEKKYGMMSCHMNTVAGNEALVTWAARGWPAAAPGGRGIEVFGLNPGLIKTGIRTNAMGTGILAQAAEWVIGKLNVSPEQYAEGITPLLFAPELSGAGGRMFNQSGAAIKPSPQITQERAAALIEESQGLVARALATAPAAAAEAKAQ